MPDLHNYCRYTINEQQEFLDALADEYGVVAYRPSYFGKDHDGYTVLFYSKEDEEFNEKVDKEGGNNYRTQFWSFDNTDHNGFVSPRFANYGSIFLGSLYWKEEVEEHFLNAYNAWREKNGMPRIEYKHVEFEKNKEDSKSKKIEERPEFEMRDDGLRIEIQHRDVNGQFYKHVFPTREEAYEFALSQEEDEILAVFEGPHTLYSWLMTTRSICWEELTGYFA